MKNIDKTSALRFSNFTVPHLVDETLREGVERSPVPISLTEKCGLLKKMTDAGLRKFIVGCGPEEPTVWSRVWDMKERGEIPAETEPTFIVLLNCWETAFAYFKSGKYPSDWIKHTVFSFGMITYRESERQFDRAVDAFQSLGVTHLKASVLNNFRPGVSPKRFDEICRQIDWAVSLGVSTIRINDSVGSLQPHVTHELCGELVRRYPGITFCLHAHNDNGLAVANTMAAIQSGFQMIEGSLAGFGNRSGIAPIEQVVKLCLNNNIVLGSDEINLKKLISCARESEKIFGAIPNIYRPVSGIFETDSNFGVLNIPDFLETNDDKNYFVNQAGLHPITLKMALSRHQETETLTGVSDDGLWDVVRRLQGDIDTSSRQSRKDYDNMLCVIEEFYRKHTITTQSITKRVINYLSEIPSVE